MKLPITIALLAGQLHMAAARPTGADGQEPAPLSQGETAGLGQTAKIIEEFERKHRLSPADIDALQEAASGSETTQAVSPIPFGNDVENDERGEIAVTPSKNLLATTEGKLQYLFKVGLVVMNNGQPTLNTSELRARGVTNIDENGWMDPKAAENRRFFKDEEGFPLNIEGLYDFAMTNPRVNDLPSANGSAPFYSTEEKEVLANSTEDFTGESGVLTSNKGKGRKKAVTADPKFDSLPTGFNTILANNGLRSTAASRFQPDGGSNSGQPTLQQATDIKGGSTALAPVDEQTRDTMAGDKAEIESITSTDSNDSRGNDWTDKERQNFADFMKERGEMETGDSHKYDTPDIYSYGGQSDESDGDSSDDDVDFLPVSGTSSIAGGDDGGSDHTRQGESKSGRPISPLKGSLRSDSSVASTAEPHEGVGAPQQYITYVEGVTDGEDAADNEGEGDDEAPKAAVADSEGEGESNDEADINSWIKGAYDDDEAPETAVDGDREGDDEAPKAAVADSEGGSDNNFDVYRWIKGAYGDDEVPEAAVADSDSEGESDDNVDIDRWIRGEISDDEVDVDDSSNEEDSNGEFDLNWFY